MTKREMLEEYWKLSFSDDMMHIYIDHLMGMMETVIPEADHMPAELRAKIAEFIVSQGTHLVEPNIAFMMEKYTEEEISVLLEQARHPVRLKMTSLQGEMTQYMNQGTATWLAGTMKMVLEVFCVHMNKKPEEILDPRTIAMFGIKVPQDSAQENQPDATPIVP